MADQKITELTEDAAPALTDLLVLAEDPTGTNVTKKMTLQSLFTLFAAVQADQEAGSATDKFVTVEVQRYHPSAAKVWCQGQTASTTILSSYNVASLTDGAAGVQTVTITDDFSSASYCVLATIGDTSTALAQSATVHTKAAGSYVLNSVIEAGSGDDPSVDWNSIGYGDL